MLLDFDIVEFSIDNQSFECTKKYLPKKWPRKLIIMKCILSKCKLSQQITQTTREVCNNINKHKHLWGSWTFEMSLSTSDLQNQPS
jgi:hypothetical protein